MRERAEIVIIGGGICGSSVAYHLTKLGRRDILLLEQGRLYGGTTSHAPGLVGQLRSSAPLVQLLKISVEIYRRLADAGCEGYQQVGSLRLASSKARLNELKSQRETARRAGLDAELIGPNEALRLFPLMDTEGVEAALYMPADGSARAPLLAEALNRAARENGATVMEGVAVTGIEVEKGRVRAVNASQGRIETETVVAATGIWSPVIGRMAGVSIPLIPMQHQVVWTEPLPELANGVSVANMRDPDNLVYARQDGESLAMGGYETTPAPFDPDAIPKGEDPTRRPFDPLRFASILEGGRRRIPAMRDAPIARTLNGLESFTPDGDFLLGEAPETAGFWMACGFCAHGVSGSGGVGKLLAEWIVNGDPGLDLATMDIRRFANRPPAGEELVRLCSAVYAAYYASLPQQDGRLRLPDMNRG